MTQEIGGTAAPCTSRLKNWMVAPASSRVASPSKRATLPIRSRRAFLKSSTRSTRRPPHSSRLADSNIGPATRGSTAPASTNQSSSRSPHSRYAGGASAFGRRAVNPEVPRAYPRSRNLPYPRPLHTPVGARPSGDQGRSREKNGVRPHFRPLSVGTTISSTKLGSDPNFFRQGTRSVNGPAATGVTGAALWEVGGQVCALPSPCRRVMRERRNTLLNLSWQACETCSIRVELTRRIVIDPLAVIDAVRLAPRT